MNDIAIKILTEAHIDQVMRLMETDHLRTEGVLEKDTRYWGAFDGAQLVGMIGCEYEGDYGLLRSALVDHEYRGCAIASLLTEELLADAKCRGLKAVYLFSTGAGEYWRRLGFVPISVDEAVGRLSHAPQVLLFERLGWLPTEAAYQYTLEK